jgi:hypothetical protein
MTRVVDLLRSLGVDGAARNARLLLDQRRDEHVAVAALQAAVPVEPSTGRDDRSVA